jgi:endoglycosylceramidase
MIISLSVQWAGDVLGDPLLLVPGVADAANLQLLWMNASGYVRAGEAQGRGLNRIIFVEGVTWDDFFPAGFTAIPGAEQGLGGLSYHYYSLPQLNIDLELASRWAGG